MQPPLLLRIPPSVAAGVVSASRAVVRALPPTLRHLCAWRFVLCPAEERFARALLRRLPQLWLFRTDQQRRVGDFLAVDLSWPRPDGRRVYGIELKQAHDLRLGGGGIQLMGLPTALDRLRDARLAIDPAATVITGDEGAILAHLAGGR